MGQRWSLRCDAVHGGGFKREQWRLLLSLPDFSHSLCYPHQIEPLLCWYPSGWACASSKPLWVSPMNSPVRLGVSPAAASTPTGVFNQRFEVLFPWVEALSCAVCFAPPLFLLVYLCMNVGPRGLLVVTLPAPFIPIHHLSGSSGVAASPLLPSCPSPPLLLVWNVSSLSPWLSDFCVVQFSVSSGCFLFLKLLLSFFWLCEEAQCVYLCLHLGQKPLINLFLELQIPYLYFFLLLKKGWLEKKCNTVC